MGVGQHRQKAYGETVEYIFHPPDSHQHDLCRLRFVLRHELRGKTRGDHPPARMGEGVADAGSTKPVSVWSASAEALPSIQRTRHLRSLQLRIDADLHEKAGQKILLLHLFTPEQECRLRLPGETNSGWRSKTRRGFHAFRSVPGSVDSARDAEGRPAQGRTASGTSNSCRLSSTR